MYFLHVTQTKNAIHKLGFKIHHVRLFLLKRPVRVEFPHEYLFDSKGPTRDNEGFNKSNITKKRI